MPGTRFAAMMTDEQLRMPGLVGSLDEFLERWPELREYIEPAIDEALLSAGARFTDNTTEPLWYEMGRPQQRLLAAAILVAVRLEIAEADLPSSLVVFVHRWR